MSRSVLVLGASSGIGRASALRFATDGDRLVLMARSGDVLEQVADECRSAGAAGVQVVAGDVAVPDDVQRAVDVAVDEHDGLDAVLHTATVMAYGTLEKLPADVFSSVVEVAVLGTFHTTRAVLPVFRRQHRGSLIFINSLLGSVTVPTMGAYAAAKWAQRALIRTLQQETRDEADIHIGMVSPGGVNTPIYYQAANFMGRVARPPVPVLQPERVAETVHSMIDRPRGNVSIPVGPANPVVIAGYRLLPALYDLMVGPVFKVVALARGNQAPTEGNVHKPVPELDGVHGHWPGD